MKMHKDIAYGNGLALSQLLILVCALLVSFSAFAADPVIRKSDYEDGDNKIQLKVRKDGRRALLTVSVVETGQNLGTVQANRSANLQEEKSLSSGQKVR